MKSLLLLFAVAFLLGTVKGDCDQAKKAECIKTQQEKVRILPGSAADKCKAANVRECVLIDAGCSEDDANSAAMQISDNLKLDCKTVDPNWEREGRCINKKVICRKNYDNAIQGKMNPDQICSALEAYHQCMSTGDCKTAAVSAELNLLMKRARIDKCENIHTAMCADMARYESCMMAADNAVIDLDLKMDEEMLCMLARTAEHCYSTKAKCDHETTKRTITNMLNKVDCSEYVDLCDHTKVELCSVKNPNPDNCGKLKDFHTCLSTNNTCPAARIHHILRNVMKDKNLDCADADACEYAKEANCDIDVSQVTSTTEEKCQLFNQYKQCMARARCNDNYMNGRIEFFNDQLGYPCGAVKGDCDQAKMAVCIKNNQGNVSSLQPGSAADKCNMANFVRVCVLIDAGCSEDDATSAAKEISDNLKLDCKKVNTNWEKEGSCINKKTICKKNYDNAIQEKTTTTDQICGALGDYQKCMTTGDCKTAVISHEMNQLAKRAGIERCENIHIAMCADMVKYESCMMAADTAVIDLELKVEGETLCMLAEAAERCYSTKAKCDRETTKQTIQNMLNEVDCSEYVNLCDHTKAEWCSVRNPNPDNCGKLKDFHTCLSTNDTCPAARIHHILRVVMKEKNLDCADADACEYAKETNCYIHVTSAKEKSTKEEKCKLFNEFKECMVRARCNDNYMNDKIKSVNDEVGHPCGASSMLASIGLTLLLAAVTGQWK